MLLETIDGTPLCSLGLAGNSDMAQGCVSAARQAGINAFFFYNMSFQVLIDGVRAGAQKEREAQFIATGSEEREILYIRKYLEQVKRALQVDTVDAFFVEYVAPTDRLDDVLKVLEEMQTWKKAGKIRYVGASVHDRALALELIRSGQLDVLMHRYNMAHRKSEEEVLPFAAKMGIPVISFTNTRWGSLLKGHARWLGPIPSAADCYRFVLRHPAVALAWTAPRSLDELQANLSVLRASRMLGEEVAQWKTYGDLIYGDGRDAFEMRWP